MKNNNLEFLLNWLGGVGICIIFAPPRTGKTCFLTHLLNTYAFDRNRQKLMSNEIENFNKGGFNLSYGKHVCYSNYDITFKKFLYSQRKSYVINPFKLGFWNPYVETTFIRPFSVIGITEGQKYFNSRMSRYYPAWQSRFFEQCGHNNLLFLIDVQRPNLIDINLRDLSKFIEIVSLKKIYKGSKISKMIWTIKFIDSSQLLDKYLNEGKIMNLPTMEITADYDVFKLYNSQNCKPKFFEGHLDQDFDLFETKSPIISKESYQNYLQELDDELPKEFYRKDGF
jgi:hypothetical protein